MELIGGWHIGKYRCSSKLTGGWHLCKYKDSTRCILQTTMVHLFNLIFLHNMHAYCSKHQWLHIHTVTRTECKCSDRPPPAPVKRRCWPRWWNPCPDGTAGSRYASTGFSLYLGFGLCDRGTHWSPPWGKVPASQTSGCIRQTLLLSGIIRLFAQIRLSTSHPKMLGVSDFPGLTYEQSTIYPESRSNPSNPAPRLRASSSLMLSASWETSSALCSV